MTRTDGGGIAPWHEHQALFIYIKASCETTKKTLRIQIRDWPMYFLMYSTKQLSNVVAMLQNCALSFPASRKATASCPCKKFRRWCPTSGFNSTCVLLSVDISVGLSRREKAETRKLSQPLTRWETNLSLWRYCQSNLNRREQTSMGSFNQYISTGKQWRPFFPTIPHSSGSQQDDRRWHLI